jgi:hypothetical protein
MTYPIWSKVPSDWRQANVISVFKKGEKYLASNYRPISLTCICYKVLEHIVKYVCAGRSFINMRKRRGPGQTMWYPTDNWKFAG